MKNKLKIIIMIIIGILVRLTLFNWVSADYKVFIEKWLEFIDTYEGVYSLKYVFTNYNLPYVIILVIISYIPIKSLYLVKTVSVIFDILLSILGYKFTLNFTKDKKKAFTCFMVILFSPIVIMNSSQWAQCDSIYAFFSLLSIYLLIKNKISLSFVAYGIAFAFKLQAIFLLPAFGILFLCKKNIKIYHFFIIPIVNFILCLPAVFFGASPLYTYKIYFTQSSTYEHAMNVMNYYNYYTRNFTFTHEKLINVIGIIITAIVFLCILIYSLKNKNKFNDKSIVLLFLLSIATCYFFLPCMHDRYLYCADILSIFIYFSFLNKKYIPIVINICSFLSYMFLMGYLPIRWVFRRIMPIFLLIDIIYIFINLRKELNKGEMKETFDS